LRSQAKSSKFIDAAAKILAKQVPQLIRDEILRYYELKYGVSIPYRKYIDTPSLQYQYHTDTLPIPPVSSSSSISSSNSGNTLSSFLSGSLSFLLSEIPDGIDKLAQHEAIKQKLADIAIARGLKAKSEYPVSGGRVDLCWLDDTGQVIAGFEIDWRTPRDKSVRKLKELGCEHAYVLLRKGGLKFISIADVQEEPNNDWSEFLALFEKHFGRVGGAKDADDLKDIADNFSLEWFELALKEMDKAGSKSLRYVQRTLANWKEAGSPVIRKDNHRGANKQDSGQDLGTEALKKSVGAPLTGN